MDRYRAPPGTPANRLPLAICRGNGTTRDRRRHRIERGSRQDPSVSRVARGTGTSSEVAMNDFRGALSSFRDAIHRQGERAEVPPLQTILSRGPQAKSLGLRWAVAAMVALMLGAIPAY